MGWNYLSIPKLQRLHRWSLGMDKLFHPTHYNGCDYLSMLGLKLNHVRKRGHRSPEAPFTTRINLFIILAWMRNYLHWKVWDEFTSTFPSFNGSTVELWEWINDFVPHFIGHMPTYPIRHWTQSMFQDLTMTMNELSNTRYWTASVTSQVITRLILKLLFQDKLQPEG